MLRHRDALVDICMERATMGVTEETVVDGELVERTKPDGAMLRHMLNRADRLCDDTSLAARPAHRSELHFEALLDCVDQDETAQAEGGPPDRAMLLAEIAASARWDWKGDPDPAESNDWTEEQWLRADRSGIAEWLFDEEEQEERGGDP